MNEPSLGNVLLVGVGGLLGSCARFLVSGWIQRLIPGHGFPLGTLCVNVIGCLAIGFLGGLGELRQGLPVAQRLFLMIGVLGGFTTFSSLAFESVALARGSEFGQAALNMAGHVVLGLGAVWLGYAAARQI